MVFVLGVVLLVVGALVHLAGSIVVAVAAFRVSVLWGVLVLLVPFAFVVFLIRYWEQGKRGFMISAAGLVLVAAAGAITAVAGARRAEAEMRASVERVTWKTESIRESGPPEGSGSPAQRSRPASIPDPSPIDAIDSDPTSTAELESGSDGGSQVEPETAPEFDRAALRAIAEPPPSGASDSKERLPAGDELTEPGEIVLADLAHHVGEDLVFVDGAGGSVRGLLLAVEPASLRIERRFSAGSIEYTIPRKEVRSVRVPS